MTSPARIEESNSEEIPLTVSATGERAPGAAAPEFVVVEVDGEPYELDYQTMEKANLVGLD